MLVSEQSRIEGPQQPILDLMLSCSIATLCERGGLPIAEADRLAHMLVARTQAQLVAYLFVVADLDDDGDDSDPETAAPETLWTGTSGDDTDTAPCPF